MALSRVRLIFGALVLALIVAAAAPASAQVRNPDSSVNPTASAVKSLDTDATPNEVAGVFLRRY